MPDVQRPPKDEPTSEETKRAMVVLMEVFITFIPIPMRPYVAPAIVAGAISAGFNVADEAYRFLGISTVIAQERQEAKIDALIEAFQVAHPDIFVPPKPKPSSP